MDLTQLVFTNPFEFRYEYSVSWMAKNYLLSFAVVALYLSLIFIGQLFMKNREPYSLRWTLFAWNVLLGAFSIIGSRYTLLEMIELLWNSGIYVSICTHCSSVSPVSSYYAWLFVLSKVFELGDTAFIILRKRNLIFLHWYHHCTVLVYTWYSYSEYISPARWFVVMNYAIHSLMYTYYALKSLKISLPRKIPLLITTLQLTQMFIGIAVNIYAYVMKIYDVECVVSKQNLEISFLIYGSYFLLFWKYFQKAYVKKNKTD